MKEFDVIVQVSGGLFNRQYKTIVVLKLMVVSMLVVKRLPLEIEKKKKSVLNIILN